MSRRSFATSIISFSLLAPPSHATPLFQTVPIPKQPLGWQLATPSAKIEVKLFYDLLCPDSKDAQTIIDLLLKEPFAGDPGTTFRENLDIKVIPFVLPYHLHSY